MIRALIFLLLVSCSVDAGEPSRVRAELQPMTINQFDQLLRYRDCKRYAESVYADMINGLTMSHPEAEGKEATALEYMKDAFIECYKPFKST